MRFVTFSKSDGKESIGCLVEDGSKVLDLTSSGLTGHLLSIVEQGQQGLQKAAKLAEKSDSLPLDSIKLLAPFPHPKRNIICVGKNYYEHSKEFEKSGFDSTSGGQTVPKAPVIFTKATTSVIGPMEPIPASADPSGSTDYEGELALVIGKDGYKIGRTEVFDYIAGYTIVNDVTARNLQQLHKQWFLGKSLNGFCPMGPAFVTADEISDPTDLQVSTWVNDELRQQASVKDLIFDIPVIVETISSIVSLVAGDIIATGTPAGVGIGFTPPKFLQPGDKVRIEIDRIGVLENPVC
jgi:2-keto-4-pentenoate hydratase/2-oxohepta-3-ene-1,7-dioic acid hydratase in catechol pathway